MNNMDFTVNKACVIGGGNVGVSAAIDLAQHPNIQVTLITSKSDKLQNKKFVRIDNDANETFSSESIIVSDKYDSVKDADLVLVTLPSFCITDLSEKIKDYKPKLILFVPGFGGKELIFRDFSKKGCMVAGFDRSLYIARLKSETEVISARKSSIRLACVDSEKTEMICDVTSKLFGLKVLPVKNYLTIAFTPSNPILHTARLYSMYKDMDFTSHIPSNIKFYAEWSDFASELIFKMDKELQAICDALQGFDMSGVIQNSVHYESATIPALTNKIRTIQSWHNIDSPMVERAEGFYIDSDSRYFKEDFPYGLCNLIGFAKILNVETPTMDTILKWYQKISGTYYYNENGDFKGKDLANACIPQNFGIISVEDIKKYYC